MVRKCVENFEQKILNEFKLNKRMEGRMDGWVGGWQEGGLKSQVMILGRWMDGWMGGNFEVALNDELGLEPG